ncbi:hypothetical protein SprV_0100492300 [Sparganum proliferum]
MNHSTLLTPEENRKLKQLVDEEGSLRAVAIVQMYLADSRLQWKYFKTGVLTLEASVRYNRVSLCLYDLTEGKRVWHQTLFNEMTYLDSTEQFHYFYGECSAVVGILRDLENGNFCSKCEEKDEEEEEADGEEEEEEKEGRE